MPEGQSINLKFAAAFYIHRLVMITTPATMRIAPKTMRGVIVSMRLRNNALKRTVKNGVVLRSGMITETSARLRAMKFEIWADMATSAAMKRNENFRAPSEAGRCVLWQGGK